LLERDAAACHADAMPPPFSPPDAYAAAYFTPIFFVATRFALRD